jgi:hypothetical protein
MARGTATDKAAAKRKNFFIVLILSIGYRYGTRALRGRAERTDWNTIRRAHDGEL